MRDKDILFDLQDELRWGLERQDEDMARLFNRAIQEIRLLRAQLKIANRAIETLERLDNAT